MDPPINLLIDYEGTAAAVALCWYHYRGSTLGGFGEQEHSAYVAQEL